jgi:hypothetical protein
MQAARASDRCPTLSSHQARAARYVHMAVTCECVGQREGHGAPRGTQSLLVTIFVGLLLKVNGVSSPTPPYELLDGDAAAVHHLRLLVGCLTLFARVATTKLCPRFSRCRWGASSERVWRWREGCIEATERCIEQWQGSGIAERSSRRDRGWSLVSWSSESRWPADLGMPLPRAHHAIRR